MNDRMHKLSRSNPEAYKYITELTQMGFEIQPFQIDLFDQLVNSENTAQKQVIYARYTGKSIIPLMVAFIDLLRAGEIDLTNYGISGYAREAFADLLCGKVHATIYKNKAVLHSIEYKGDSK